MQPLDWKYRPDALRAPAMVCAFRGWNDASDAATSALRFIRRTLRAQQFASIDPEEFYDFQNTRPRIRLSEDQSRRYIRWPEVRIYEARIPRAPRDLILVTGAEPSYRWRTFTELVVELAEVLGAQLIVTLGALLADVPHTRPVSVTGFATDPALMSRVTMRRSNYEGPTGILGVLHDACVKSSMPSSSLWASVPHYISASPNPKAALALIRALEGVVGVAIDAGDLEVASADYERQVNLAVQSDPDILAFVERLEQSAPEEESPPYDLPSGESIARDLQRFLRQRDEQPPDGS